MARIPLEDNFDDVINKAQRGLQIPDEELAQRADVSLADLLARFGFVVTPATPFAELLTVTLPRVGALLPFLMMVLILVFRPRGLMGTRDT